MSRGFHSRGMFKGRRRGSPRIINKRSWLNRSRYYLWLSTGMVGSPNVWFNDGTGGISSPWDNSEAWNNRG